MKNPEDKKEDVFEKLSPRIYTPEEISRFSKNIEKFYEDYTIENGKDHGKVIRVLNRNRLWMAYGAADRKGAVHPNRQEQLENLLNQYYDWKSKKEFAEKKQNEEWENVAKEIAVDKKIAGPVIPEIDPADVAFDKW